MDKKKCSQCRKIKPLSEYSRDSYASTKYRSQCKQCIRDNAAKGRESKAKARVKKEEYIKKEYPYTKGRSYCTDAGRKISNETCFVYLKPTCQQCTNLCKEESLKFGRHSIDDVDPEAYRNINLFGSHGQHIETATETGI